MTEPANWPLHRSIKTTGNHLVLLVLVFLTLYPFFFMLTTSLKSIAQFYHGIWGVGFPLHWDNYVTAFQELQSHILNSVAVSAGSALGVVALGSLTAYVFAFYRFPAKNVLFYAILSILMIPGVLTLVPAFMVVKQLGLLNTRWVMILPYISGGQVIAIFILRSFFETIPRDLCDSARVDGANDFHIYRMIVYPLAKPIVGVIVIMDILGSTAPSAPSSLCMQPLKG